MVRVAAADLGREQLVAGLGLGQGRAEGGQQDAVPARPGPDVVMAVVMPVPMIVPMFMAVIMVMRMCVGLLAVLMVVAMLMAGLMFSPVVVSVPMLMAVVMRLSRIVSTFGPIVFVGMVMPVVRPILGRMSVLPVVVDRDVGVVRRSGCARHGVPRKKAGAA
ncbi:hypothetical protein [Desulfolutivibrio sp.]|uniref:hypothetical protein n=1 Tax=Desulfolutivibrio sp. TaxID=2773296 RepID=UPI002F966915